MTFAVRGDLRRWVLEAVSAGCFPRLFAGIGEFELHCTCCGEGYEIRVEASVGNPRWIEV
jgi:hypothetical protein